MSSINEYGEEQHFEKIFLKLSSACKLVLEALPRINFSLSESRRTAIDRMTNEAESNKYEAAHDCGKALIDAAETLQTRLSALKLKEPKVREHLEFWQVCTAFTRVRGTL